MREIGHAEEFVGAQTFDEFAANRLCFYAVVRCLEIISEASRRLPEALKERHPHIEWKGMAAAGNIYRHDYGNVLALIVWETVRSLPELRAVIEHEIAN